MKKEVKDTIIVDLGEKLKEYPHFYLVDVTGMNAEATSSLRRKCFKQEIKMVVVKNKLLHKAFEAADIDYSELYGTLKGNTAVLFANTANVPAKLLKDKEIAKAGVPSLKAAYAEKVSMLVPTSSMSWLPSRARTRLLPTSLLCCRAPQRTWFLLFSQAQTLSMVC